MQFVKHYTSPRSSLVQDMQEISQIADCADGSAILEVKGENITAKFDVSSENITAFIHCAAQFLDEHTISGWEFQIEQEEDRFKSGKRRKRNAKK